MDDASRLIRKARLFDFYARRVWPAHRLLVRRHLARRCRRCAASERFVHLGTDGTCDLCNRVRPGNSPEVLQFSGANSMAVDLDGHLSAAQGRGVRSYDALVMVSGGKDSALLLHQLRARFCGLRLLALTIDNGFMSPVALANAAQMTRVLEVDHWVVKPHPSLFAKSFAYACRHPQEGKGCSGSVDGVDAALGFDIAKNAAAANEIPLILCGLSWAQCEHLFDCRSFDAPPSLMEHRTERALDVPLDELYSAQELLQWWDPARYRDRPLPRLLFPFYVWRHEEDWIRRRVIEWGLIDEGNDSPLVTNGGHVTLSVVIDHFHLGYASFEPEFCDLIRHGKADKSYWRSVFEMVEYSAKTGWMLGDDISTMLARLHLMPREVDLPAR